MTQEEKAKAYDEAIEKLRSLHDNYDTVSTLIDIKEELEHIFPELRESEDEKTRKALISFLKSPFVNKNITDEKVAPWLAWLEKQGQNKCIDGLTQQEAMDIAVAKCFEQGEQKHALDIEIPFGAKDIELQEATYLIPEGFHAEIKDDKVVIKKGEQKPTWSKRDEETVTGIINDIQERLEDYPAEQLADIYFKEIKWLKSIKQRIS